MNVPSGRRQEILETVEMACYDAIAPQVLGISAEISFDRFVNVHFFNQGVLPEEDRDYLVYALEEMRIELGPWTPVRIISHDNQKEPLKRKGNWIFVRRGTQSD